MIATILSVPCSRPAVQQGAFADPTPQTRALGRARAAFFKDILKVGERHEDVDYSGYRSMLMVDHTTMLWPVGRADEVVFVYGSGGHSLLTQWRRDKGLPRRLFQIAFVEGKRAFPYVGTMSKYLGKVKASVPKRYAKPLKSLLSTERDYACYLGSAAMGVYYCTIVRADGTNWPGLKVDLELVPQQNDGKIDQDGFGITKEELRLLAGAKKG